jgi:transposase-like protein
MDLYCPYCYSDKFTIKRGKNHRGKLQYYCKGCCRWFGATTGTMFYYSHFSKVDIIKICEYIVEGKSIRTIAELMHHHRDTIRRLLDFIASNAYEINETLPFTDYHKNLLWYRIKKRKRTWSDSAQRGLIEIRKGTSRYIRKEYR